MKKILLTNLNIVNYSGSEIDTVTIANVFVKLGYDVTIFTLEYGYPLLEKVNSKIKIIDYYSLNELNSFYDIIWAHHFPLLDFLLFNKKIKADYIHYISLSTYMPAEALPVYYKDLSLISVVSKETLTLLKKNGFNTSNFKIFPNYASNEYFSEINNNRKLHKIVIVSNHIPNELLEFKKIAEENELIVDIYGIGYNYTFIDDKILNKYDLVISIGKTVNYAIALGIPVYCYDWFGGDSYIKTSNIKKSFDFHFSGKSFGIKLSGKEIYNDIIANYSDTLSNLTSLQKFAYDNFSLDSIINKTLDYLFLHDKFNINLFLEKNKKIAREHSLFVDEIGKKINQLRLYSNNIEYYQIYYDIGNDFNENDSIVKNYYREKNNIYKSSIILPKNYKKIRFDFTNQPFVYVKSILINNKKYINYSGDNFMIYKKGLITVNDDPSITIARDKLDTNKLNITIEMYKLNSVNVINELIDEARYEERIIQREKDEKEIFNKKLINKIKRRIKKIINHK